MRKVRSFCVSQLKLFLHICWKTPIPRNDDQNVETFATWLPVPYDVCTSRYRTVGDVSETWVLFWCADWPGAPPPARCVETSRRIIQPAALRRLPSPTDSHSQPRQDQIPTHYFTWPPYPYCQIISVEGRHYVRSVGTYEGCRSGPFWSDPENCHRIWILSVLWQCEVE